MSCLGDVVAALVDGELEHAARERAQRHLAHCADCRVEVDAQRRLKARLTGAVDDPAPSDALTARLLGLRPPGEPAALPRTALSPARPATARTAAGPALRPGAGPAALWDAAPRPASRRRRGLRRGAAVGSAVAVLGAALALGSPQPSGPSTPIDPGTDAFVVDFVSTTSGAPGSVGPGR